MEATIELASWKVATVAGSVSCARENLSAVPRGGSRRACRPTLDLHLVDSTLLASRRESFPRFRLFGGRTRRTGRRCSVEASLRCAQSSCLGRATGVPSTGSGSARAVEGLHGRDSVGLESLMRQCQQSGLSDEKRVAQRTLTGSSPMRSAIPCSRRSRSSWMYRCSSNNIVL